MAGMLLLIFRKMIRKIILKITSKIAGKVIAKLVPVIGWILVALAVWDAAQAKSRLETEQDVAIARHFVNWPVVGLALVELAQQWGRLAYLLVYGLLGGLLLLVARPVLRRHPRRVGKR